ncbi:MAG: serine hydrolase [bacterium]|nr:serine hydrolase [bacterium]
MNETFKKLQANVRPEYFFWAAVLCASLFLVTPPRTIPSQENAAVIVATASSTENPYTTIDLSAKAAYVYDLKARQPLFSRNADEVLPLASVTKIMTAITALSLAPPTTYVTITKEAVQEEGDSGLKVGERWLLRDLLTFMLIESSNDGAAAVSESIGATLGIASSTETDNRQHFIVEMNALARRIDLPSTSFLNESGLDSDAEQAGAFSSAAETARMLGYALTAFPKIFSETHWSELTLGNEAGEAYAAKNTNTAANNLPLLIASKTGYTDLAGGNLVIAFDAGFNHPIIISVLGSTVDGRFTDVEKLVWATLQYLQQN